MFSSITLNYNFFISKVVYDCSIKSDKETSTNNDEDQNNSTLNSQRYSYRIGIISGL